MIKKLYHFYLELKLNLERKIDKSSKKLENKDPANKGFKSFNSVFLLVILVLIISSVVTVFSLNRVYLENIKSFNKERLNYINVNINNNLNKWFYNRINDLLLLRDSYHLTSFIDNLNSGKKDDFIETGLISKINNQIENYSLNSLSAISVANKDGLIVLSNDLSKKGTTISSYSFYKNLKDGYIYITNVPFYNIKTKEYVYLIAVPVFNPSGVFVGTILAYYRWSNLLENILGFNSYSLHNQKNHTIDIVDTGTNMSILLNKEKELNNNILDWVKNIPALASGSIVQKIEDSHSEIYINYLRFSKENNFDVDFTNKLIFPSWIIVSRYQLNLVETAVLNISFLSYSSLVIFIYLIVLVALNYLIFFRFTKNVIGDDLFSLKNMLDNFLNMRLDYKTYLTPDSGIVKKIYDISFMLYRFISNAKSNIITVMQYKQHQINELKHLKSLNTAISKDISQVIWYNSQNANISEEINRSLETIINLNSELSDILKNRSELVDKIKASKNLAVALSNTKTEIEQLDLEFKEIKDINTKNKEILSSINNKIKEIDEQSVELQNTNQTIQTIATQTNLLSVNAAIEANNAGIAGKGFAIIAEEIKSLSEDSSTEALNTSNNIVRIKNDIYNLSKESDLIKKSLTHFDATLEVYATNRNIYKNNVYSKVNSISESLSYLDLLESTLLENENFISAMKKISNDFSNDFDNVMMIRNSFNDHINKLKENSKEIIDKITIIDSINNDELNVLENTKKDLDSLFENKNTMEEID